MNCSACGKSMKVGKGDMVCFSVCLFKTKEEEKELKKHLHPYKVGKWYNICYPCAFKAIGVKP